MTIIAERRGHDAHARHLRAGPAHAATRTDRAGDHRPRRGRDQPVADPGLPPRRPAGPGLRDRGRRRQPLPRLQRRHRRRRCRSRPSRRQRRDPRPGRRRPALLLERLLPARATPTCASAWPPSPRWPMPGSSSSNSGTEAVEAALKLARHHTRRPNVIAFLGAFHGRSLGSLSLTASKARQRAGFGIVTPGSLHAPYFDPYDDAALTRRGVHRRGPVQAPHRPERRCGDLRRADPGRGRVHRATGRLAGRPADAVRRARHPARARRGAVRRRPHRHDVGGRARRCRARHHVHRQGPGQRAAPRRHRRPVRRHGLGAGRSRLDVRRQPGGLRRCAGHARPRRVGAGRQRRRRRRAPADRAASDRIAAASARSAVVG